MSLEERMRAAYRQGQADAVENARQVEELKRRALWEKEQANKLKKAISDDIKVAFDRIGVIHYL